MNKRGFARLSKEDRVRIATMGGKASSASNKAHKWDSKSAKKAGEKGRKVRDEKYKVKNGESI